MGVSGNLWNFVKDVKTLVVYDVEWKTAMDSMKGKCASSWVDLGYTNQFCVPEVTSVFYHFFVILGRCWFIQISILAKSLQYTVSTGISKVVKIPTSELNQKSGEGWFVLSPVSVCQQTVRQTHSQSNHVTLTKRTPYKRLPYRNL